MPRPKTKEELLHQSQTNLEKLFEYIDKFDEVLQQREFPRGTMNRNIRDILAHLYHWHLMMLRWYAEGMAGKKPKMPAEGYTWKTVPDLNRKIWKQYLDYPLSEIRKKLNTSHKKVMQLIDDHSNEELFEKKRYPWTGSTSLGAYLISASSSHYDWALKLLKKATSGW